MDEKATIPRETISRLVKHYLVDKQLTVTPEVIEGISKYLESFVQEATLRSIENHELNGHNQELVLEYDDLEKIIGLLMLDM
ncbi:similar to Saccharomyces cerevisiae YDL160C-A Putative protein of unknown function [Maudiozyma barnettii]|uniref:MHF histone-fold complex subunit 2 n=1 Tax=Maudiozyma barnettii TaxID=61262 RepID=A0A8H2VBG8_9SACH|nr:Mhf2p [Kazachstania barnettii]CAB4252193.1 similar to Saccharomyces cerevisiae YDL160C-A Putative protein of unknown function [Kazachstania barnettii]CAD1778805.1 similar to Saccharomyces cerevisiae YDL160C-A Putative protein of unknown function [Kazachstania barnettii]